MIFVGHVCNVTMARDCIHFHGNSPVYLARRVACAVCNRTYRTGCVLRTRNHRLIYAAACAEWAWSLWKSVTFLRGTCMRQP
jgi:hypothetical protein